MSSKRPDVRERIEDYRRISEQGTGAQIVDASRRALSDRHYLLVAKAAELAGNVCSTIWSQI